MQRSRGCLYASPSTYNLDVEILNPVQKLAAPLDIYQQLQGKGLARLNWSLIATCF